MKTRIALATAALVALAVVSTATGGPPNTATVAFVDPNAIPTSGETLYVRFEVTGTTPVVPYEYAVQNTCTSKNGNFTVGQRDDIVYWEDVNTDLSPDVIVPVYLQSVPATWKCKVALMRNNTVVKGSAKSYTVL